MAYREVTMVEVKEVLRQWLDGEKLKTISRRLGVARNTVRRYTRAAEDEGIAPPMAASALTEERLAAVMLRLAQPPEREHGDAWATCAEQRKFIEERLKHGLRLTRVHRLLQRNGVVVPYMTLYRYAVAELDFGGKGPSIPVADCEPGEEVQLDTGWMTLLEPNEEGKRRRFRAWIFTSVHTRHRFVYPCFRETTETAIAACEAAWRFFGGVFRVLIPDNTKTIVARADPIDPLIAPVFLEYSQARGFYIDPARAKRPKDKARVERTVPDVREDCFRGETLHSIEDCLRRGETWSLKEYGVRRHTRTQRLPLEHFEAVEKSVLKPAPTDVYHVPKLSTPKVGPDQHVVVERALYSLPRIYKGKRVEARTDPWTVRFYYNRQLIRTRTRQPPGGRDTVREDFPEEKSAVAERDTAFLIRQAKARGAAVGRFAEVLLSGPLPWTRMRRVFALLGLCRRFDDAPVNEACERALAEKMHDIKRLCRMLELAVPPPAKAPPARVIPIARYLRDPKQFALPLFHKPNDGEKK